MAGIFEAVLGREVLKSVWSVGLILIFFRYCLSQAFDSVMAMPSLTSIAGWFLEV